MAAPLLSFQLRQRQQTHAIDPSSSPWYPSPLHQPATSLTCVMLPSLHHLRGQVVQGPAQRAPAVVGGVHAPPKVCDLKLPLHAHLKYRVGVVCGMRAAVNRGVGNRVWAAVVEGIVWEHRQSMSCADVDMTGVSTSLNPTYVNASKRTCATMHMSCTTCTACTSNIIAPHNTSQPTRLPTNQTSPASSPA